MKSLSSLRGVYNTIMANLEEKTRKIENLECKMKNASDVTPEATYRIENKRLYSETLSGNHQKRAEQTKEKPSNLPLRAEVATASNI